MKVIILLILTLFSIIVNGQVRQPHSLYFMETIPQITQMNPAFQPRANVYVMLPGVNASMISDLAMKDICQQQKKNWYIPIQKDYDYSKLWESIGEKKTVGFKTGVDIDIIGYGLRVGDGYFSFGISEHINTKLTLPSELFKLAEQLDSQGRLAFDFSALHAQSMSYMQLRFGYSHKLNDRLTVGMNIKPLLGQAAFVSEVEKFRLVREGTKWNTELKGNISTSKIAGNIEWDDEKEIYDVMSKNFDDYRTRDWIKYGFDFSNPGIAFDIGAAYRITERLEVSAALNNLGFVSWKDDLKWFSSGINATFDEEFTEDEINEWLESLKDELNHSLEFREQQDKFKMKLAPVFQTGVSYRFTRSVSAGFLSRSVFWENNFRQSFNVSGYFQPYSFFALSAGTTWHVKSNFNMSTGLTFLLGPLQIYFFADNIPTRFSTLKDEEGEEIKRIPLHIRTFTTRVGINLVFGQHGFTNKPMMEKRKDSWN